MGPRRLVTPVLLPADLERGWLVPGRRPLGLLTTLSVVLLTPRGGTGSSTSLLGWSPLLVAELWRLLAATPTLLAGLVLVVWGPFLGWLLAPGFGRPASCSSSLAARLLVTLCLEVPLSDMLCLVILDRALLGSLPATTRLAGSGGPALLSTLALSSAFLLVRWPSAGILIPSPPVLSALALAAAVLVVHVVARAKVRGRANKRRPPFTGTGTESPC